MPGKGKIKNPYYKAFLDGYLLEVITREDIIKVMENITQKQNPETSDQAQALVLTMWASGRRPNEVLRLKGSSFQKTKEYLQIRMPASKGSEKTMISLPCFLDEEMTKPDPLVIYIHEYIRKYILPDMYAFWFFRSKALRHGVTKTYKKKDGTIVKKRYDKIYDELSSKLRYYFPKWFDVIFPEGIPPYYLRHNRGTVITDNAGREAARRTLGHKSEVTTNRYVHQTKEVRKKIGKSLMK